MKFFSLFISLIIALFSIGGYNMMSDHDNKVPPIPDNTSQSIVIDSGISKTETVTSEPYEETSEPEISTDVSSPVTETQIIWADDDVLNDVGEGVWEDKTVTDSLWQAFNNTELASGKSVFAIGVIFRNYDEQFVYNGKTILEYKSECNDAIQLIEKLTVLLKEGDYLKYGDNIYKTGATDGTRWTEEQYKSVIEYYGEKILSDYIVDGTFMRSKVISDIKNAQAKQNVYDEALVAYLNETAQFVQKGFSEKNIQFDLVNKSKTSFGSVCMIIYATQDQFSNISLSDFGLVSDDVVFTLASRAMINGTNMTDIGDL